MKVTTISAAIKYSKQIPGGGWANAEMGAEATLDPGEDWKTAQGLLYLDLKGQVKNLFHTRTGGTEAVIVAPNGHNPASTSPAPETGPTCPEHGKAKPSAKGGGVYCPTKIGADQNGKPIYCKWEYKPAPVASK